MKFLFIPTCMFYDIPMVLQDMGHSVDTLESELFNATQTNADQNALLENKLKNSDYDVVISYLFIPAISDICYALQIPYAAWVYDSPLISLFSNSIFHETNYIFIFDKTEYLRLVDLNVPHVYYLPLAVNTKRLSSLIITDEDEASYSHDISFVGSLYENNSYNTHIHLFSEIIQLKSKLYLMKNMCHWETPRSWPTFPSEGLDYIYSNFNIIKEGQPELLSDAQYWGLLMYPRKLAELERNTALTMLATDFDLHLYTNSSSSSIPNLHIHPSVNYYTDMSKVFYFSKINLNIILPSIETGIPLRVLDIMGAGGFVLTNYQEELEDFFEIGKDLEVYHNLTELKEKVSYYLSHEDERLRIALHGYKKVHERFSYEKQLSQIIKKLPIKS